MASLVRAMTQFAKAVFTIVRTERLTLMAGGVSYFTVLAVVPLIVAFASIGGLFLSAQDLDRVIEGVGGVLPNVDDGTLQHITTIANDTSQAAFTASTIIAIGVGVYGASRVVIGLREALDSVFGLRVARGGLVARLVAALIALVLLILGVLGAVALTVVPTVTQALGVDFSRLSIVNWVLAYVLIGVALRLIFRFAPHGRVSVSWLAPGVWFAALWIIAVTGLLGFYVSFSTSVNAAVIALGAPIVLLLWVYLVTFGALLGASVVEATRAVNGTSGADQSPVR